VADRASVKAVALEVGSLEVGCYAISYLLSPLHGLEIWLSRNSRTGGASFSCGSVFPPVKCVG
jgi:hypothetical protein